MHVFIYLFLAVLGFELSSSYFGDKFSLFVQASLNYNPILSFPP
jgi:hypothetical protein